MVKDKILKHLFIALETRVNDHLSNRFFQGSLKIFSSYELFWNLINQIPQSRYFNVPPNRTLRVRRTECCKNCHRDQRKSSNKLVSGLETNAFAINITLKFLKSFLKFCTFQSQWLTLIVLTADVITCETGRKKCTWVANNDQVIPIHLKQNFKNCPTIVEITNQR